MGAMAGSAVPVAQVKFIFQRIYNQVKKTGSVTETP